MNNNRTVRKLTEGEETNEPNESMSESDESISHLEEIKTIEDRRTRYTAVVRIIGIKQEFAIDTGLPVTIMPPRVVQEMFFKAAQKQPVYCDRKKRCLSTSRKTTVSRAAPWNVFTLRTNLR